VITLDQNTLSYRIINEFDLSEDYFYYNRCTNIVAEDVIAIALSDSLVYYNLTTGNYNSIMQFNGDPQMMPIIISLPNDYFVYVNDNMNGLALRKYGIYSSVMGIIYLLRYVQIHIC
jgi:hypothetical protein